MSGPQPNAGVMDMPAYIGGREKVTGIDNPFKLSANENPLGAGPKALQALADLADPSIYPDGNAHALRDKLAKMHDIEPSQIVCGNGSDEILHLLAQAYLGPGDEVLHTAHAFLIYKLASRAAGATPISVDETDLTANVDALLAAVTDKTKMVFLANPNNPTGTMIDQSELERLHAGLGDDTLLVLDGAYAEYVDPTRYPAAFDLVERFGNVVTTRSFSKAYGLAALRLGWGYCPPPVAAALNRFRGPFNVNAAALAAGLAALDDQAHIEKSRAHNVQWRDWLIQQLGGLGLTVRPSETNFIVLELADRDTAMALEALLNQRGVIPRNLEVYGLANMVRLSIGTQAANRAALAGVQAFQNGAKA